MAKRTGERRLSRNELNALRVAAPDVDEERHFYTCAACGQRVDMRRLGDLLHHEDEGHAPLPDDPPPPRFRFIAPLLPVMV